LWSPRQSERSTRCLTGSPVPRRCSSTSTARSMTRTWTGLMTRRYAVLLAAPFAPCEPLHPLTHPQPLACPVAQGPEREQPHRHRPALPLWCALGAPACPSFGCPWVRAAARQTRAPRASNPASITGLPSQLGRCPEAAAAGQPAARLLPVLLPRPAGSPAAPACVRPTPAHRPAARSAAAAAAAIAAAMA
jgi:hypothetical protein